VSINDALCECASPWIEPDNSCGRCKKNIDPKRIKIASEVAEKEANSNVEIVNRTSQENRRIIENLLTELTQNKKYRKAIKGGEFAAFSLIGTKDWEDYASLSLQSLQMLTLLNIDENLEKIRKLLENSKNSN
jgi:hypothetical protein